CVQAIAFPMYSF
nr:immunoglobulin light chain junction region [Macaca mulatta]